jgi:type IV pilus assembly protein PilN
MAGAVPGVSGFAYPYINLASQPFRRERAHNAALGVISACLLCSLLALAGLISQERARAADLWRSIAAENKALQKAQQDQARFSAILGKAENSDVFGVSVFLNELIARRAVSWTRVFRDLGTVMPNDVQLIGVRLPQVPSEDTGGVNHLHLDMLLGTDKPEEILDLLKRLQDSKMFGAAQMMAQQPPTQNDPLYKFRVRVAYDQKL